MTLQIWIALATANFLACLAPGQNAALMGAAAARSGLMGGVFAMFGILLAELAWAVIAIYLTFGAQELVGETFVLLQIASAGVLIWFGIRAMREGVCSNPVKAHKSAMGLVGDGVIIGLANPLALVFFISVFPAFVPPGTSGAGAALFFISAILVSSVAGSVPYLAAGGILQRVGRTAALHLISGGTLAGIGGIMLLRAAA